MGKTDFALSPRDSFGHGRLVMKLNRRQWAVLTGGSLASSLAAAQDRKLSNPVHRVANARIDSTPPAPATLAPTPANHAAHPLDRALQMAQASLDHSRRDIVDYTALMVKRETVGGTLGEHQYMAAKVRNRKVDANGRMTRPLSVYLNFLRPTSVKGRECIYVEGQNDGNVIAHEGGFKGRFLPTVTVQPTGMLAMRGQRYPITEIGLENLVLKLIERGGRVRSMDGVTCTFNHGAKVKDRDCTMIEVKVPQRLPGADFHKAQVFLDSEYNLPTRYIAWDWPSRAGGPLQVLEEYTYLAIKFNVGLTDDTFNPHNKRYSFYS